MSMAPFEKIVIDHGPMVLRVCRALLGPADAEDAWSETFLSAMKAYPDLPPDANIEAWLVRIAQRKAIDASRAAARRAIAVECVPETSSTLGSPEHRDPDLWSALAALPRRQRLAVAYHHVAGLPYREIAAITGASVEAARRAAADGIKTLRETCPDINTG